MKRLNALAKVKKLTCDMAAEVAHLSSGAESALKCRQRDELNAENVISKSKHDLLATIALIVATKGSEGTSA